VTVEELKRAFPTNSKWVRLGMHNDCDYWVPVDYRSNGSIDMQRMSGIQHQPTGAPDTFNPNQLEMRKR
jgi:hypothetical protein